MKTLKFYQVTDWMLAIGEGFTPATGLLALIYSFNKNGSECKASTAYLASFCGCSRRKIFSELDYLLTKGFISANKGAKTEIVGYTVNVEVCKKAAKAYAQDAQELMQEMHKPYAQDAQAYAGDAQELMHEMHTEYKREILESNIRGEKEKKASSSPLPLTDEQINHIKYGFKYDACKHSAGYYIEKCRTYGYDKVIGFIYDDGGKDNPKEQDDMKYAEYLSKLGSDTDYGFCVIDTGEHNDPAADSFDPEKPF